MSEKPAPKDERKRTKKPGKIADLPAKSLKGKDAAKVKGGEGVDVPPISPTTSNILKSKHDTAKQSLTNVR